MNPTYQTHSTISEARGSISSEQTIPEIPGINSDGLSSPVSVELPVIARIPDLDAPSPPSKHRHSSRSRKTKLATISGRLLSASLSMKLLAGLGLLLLLGAIVPYVVDNVADNFQSKNGNAVEQAWQPRPPAPTADLAPAWKPPTAQTQSSSELWSNISASTAPGSPQVLASNERLAADDKAAPGKGNKIATSSPPGRIKPESVASAQNSPRSRDVDDQSDFSPWPNPTHPISVEADPQRNEPYTADRRNAPLSGAAQLEGTINTPSDRNTYDRSRPSIH